MKSFLSFLLLVFSASAALASEKPSKEDLKVFLQQGISSGIVYAPTMSAEKLFSSYDVSSIEVHRPSIFRSPDQKNIGDIYMIHFLAHRRDGNDVGVSCPLELIDLGVPAKINAVFGKCDIFSLSPHGFRTAKIGDKILIFWGWGELPSSDFAEKTLSMSN